MLQESTVHGLPSSQSAAVWQQFGMIVLLHSWFVQESVVHGLPSLQSVFVWQQPAMWVCEQLPVVGSHRSFVHRLPSSQLTGVPPSHAPLTQVSMPLQALPSEQVPVGAGT